MDKTIDTLVKDLKPLDIIQNVEGPFVDDFSGRTYYTGIIADKNGQEVKVKFNIKYVEYGKVRIVKTE